MKDKKGIIIIIAGAIIGFLSASLVKMGNPGNMGLCIACFLRDIAGAVGIHNAKIVQYIRPEVIGIVIGAFCMSLIGKEFKSKGGSSPFTRFILGFMVMIGALMFLGCPMRMVLRIAGGDMNAVVGLVGFIAGILVGIVCLKKGFSLRRTYKQGMIEGTSISIVNVALLILLIAAPAFIIFSAEGPGSMHAPIYFALGVGMVAGIIGQKTRLCMVGGIRDTVMFKDTYLLKGFLSIILFAFIGNLIFGQFKFGFEGQPIAHNDGLWNFLGMVVVGWGSVLLGGCPFRQLILAGEGNSDSSITILGMVLGAAFCHNFKLASSGKGPTPNGKVAVIICVVVLLVISYLNSEKFADKKAKNKEKGVKVNAN
ncbi:YedE family putative selenium transporter [Hathewaya proteolytica]|nr:YedE family putative selenium transporter [Hathewaya proteolytica]